MTLTLRIVANVCHVTPHFQIMYQYTKCSYKTFSSSQNIRWSFFQEYKTCDLDLVDSNWDFSRHFVCNNTPAYQVCSENIVIWNRIIALNRCHIYWAIQAGLLTPLTFARHRLSPLAAFTSGAYFLHNWRRWQWICKFYTANFKGIFGCP